MISTEQGAWCDTLFGTEPSRNRRAPVMPLLPTTIRSASRSSATSRIASAGSPSRAKISTSMPACADEVGGVAQRGVDLFAGVDHPLQVGGGLAGLFAQAGLGYRLVGGDEADAGAERLGEVDRLVHGLAGRLGPVRAYDDRAEHGAIIGRSPRARR